MNYNFAMMNFKSIVSSFSSLKGAFLFVNLLGALITSDAFANEIFAESVNDTKQWKKDRIIRGFTVYTSQRKNSDIVPIKVEGEIEAPITAIMENLRTIEGSEEWTPDLVSKITIADHGAPRAITYSLTDMPWPLYDRVLILDNELFLDKERKLLFVQSKTVSVDRAKVPRSEKTIEAFVGYSNMGFRPISKDRTFVEFTAWVDPRGSIPAWVINFFQKKWPISFFKALEERCEDHSPKLRPGLQAMLKDLLKEMDWDPAAFD